MIERAYHISNVVDGKFLRLPYALFASPKYKTLTPAAKIIYSVLLDRMTLSLTNRWINDDGEVYIYYTRKDMAKYTGISKSAVINSMRELINVGLLVEEQQNIRILPNKLYVLKPELSDEQAEQYTDEREKENETYEFGKNDENSTVNTIENYCSSTKREPKMSRSESVPREVRIQTARGRNSDRARSESAPQNKTDISNTEKNQTSSSSKRESNNIPTRVYAGEPDVEEEEKNREISTDEILEHCEIERFPEKTRTVFANVIDSMTAAKEITASGVGFSHERIMKILRSIDYGTLRDVEKTYNEKSAKVHNNPAYLRSLIINAALAPPARDVYSQHCDGYLPNDPV